MAVKLTTTLGTTVLATTTTLLTGTYIIRNELALECCVVSCVCWMCRMKQPFQFWSLSKQWWVSKCISRQWWIVAASMTEKKGLCMQCWVGERIITSAIGLGVALLGLGLFSLLLLLGGSNRLRDVAILVQEVENVIREGGHDYNDLGIDLVCDRCGLERWGWMDGCFAKEGGKWMGRWSSIV